MYWNFTDWDNVSDNGNLSVIGTLEESYFAGKRNIQLLINDYLFDRSYAAINLW